LPEAPEGFEEFFRAAYPQLVRTAMTAGARLEEAEDAAGKTMVEMIARWPVTGHPMAWARRAVYSNFIKEKTRGNPRIAQRLIESGLAREGTEDTRLTELEDRQWVDDALSVLSPEQRKVMECIALGLDREEIAEALGKSRDNVRRHLSDARRHLAQLLHPDGELREQPSSPATAQSSREEAR
jgi:RNA polymerase sigma factor (sigma-70 family)